MTASSVKMELKCKSKNQRPAVSFKTNLVKYKMEISLSFSLIVAFLAFLIGLQRKSISTQQSPVISNCNEEVETQVITAFLTSTN